MAVDLEKITAHYIALLATRRGRAITILIVAIIIIFTLVNIANDAYQRPSTVLEKSSKQKSDADWSRFAYTQYVTSSEYLCNAIMLLQKLHHLKSRADRVLMYPEEMLPDPEDRDGGGLYDAELMIKARDEYGVKLVPIQVQHKDTIDDTWSNSYTKLLAFNQTQYERVITIDSDATLLNHMDELFHLPPCPIAMPRAYWLLGNETTKKTLASHVMVIQPSKQEFDRIRKEIKLADKDEYDMELLNKLYRNTALVLPHRQYTMLSSEFRETNHSLYLGSDTEEWDPTAALSEVKTIHFSDYPVPKPWKKFLTYDDRQNIIKLEPKCEMKKRKTKKKNNKNKDGDDDDDNDDKEEDCSGRDVWRDLYADFKKRKGTVCARKVWSKSKPEEVMLGPLREAGMVDLNPIPYVDQEDSMSVTLMMKDNGVR